MSSRPGVAAAVQAVRRLVRDTDGDQTLVRMITDGKVRDLRSDIVSATTDRSAVASGQGDLKSIERAWTLTIWAMAALDYVREDRRPRAHPWHVLPWPDHREPAGQLIESMRIRRRCLR